MLRASYIQHVQYMSGAMKTKADFWEAHCKKHPSFRNDNESVHVRVSEIRHLFDEAYQAGVNDMASLIDKLKDIQSQMARMGVFTQE